MWRFKTGAVAFLFNINLIACTCHSRVITKKNLSCRGHKTLRICKIIRYMQHCYGTVRFIIYNTDSKSPGYYSVVKSTSKLSDTTNTLTTYESTNKILEMCSLIIAERPRNAQRQPKP